MKVHSGKVIVVVMMALLMGGCASGPEVRPTLPYQTFTSANTPKQVVECIKSRLLEEKGRGIGEGSWEAVAFEELPDQTYHIVLTVHPYKGIADILIKPSGSGSVIEYRREHWWAGEEQFLETFRVLCAGQE